MQTVTGNVSVVDTVLVKMVERDVIVLTVVMVVVSRTVVSVK